MEHDGKERLENVEQGRNLNEAGGLGLPKRLNWKQKGNEAGKKTLYARSPHSLAEAIMH